MSEPSTVRSDQCGAKAIAGIEAQLTLFNPLPEGEGRLAAASGVSLRPAGTTERFILQRPPLRSTRSHCRLDPAIHAPALLGGTVANGCPGHARASQWSSMQAAIHI